MPFSLLKKAVTIVAHDDEASTVAAMSRAEATWRCTPFAQYDSYNAQAADEAHQK